MDRRTFLRTGGVSLALSGLGIKNAAAFIPAHNWDKYDFGSGPPVTDRLYQGPFPQYPPEEIVPGSEVVMATIPSKEVVPNYGMGLVTYICDEAGPPKTKGESLAESIEKLARLPLGNKLYIRLDWRDIQKRPGRLDFCEHWKLTFEMAKKYQKKVHPLLYQKIPVKLSDEWDRSQLGNIQTDLVEHCGQSARGEYINTVSNTDIATGWWEGEAIMSRGQIPTCEGLDRARKRFPFARQEVHSDNGAEYINAHLFNYTQKEGLGFSRSRPNKKNDNCFVEQKNWTHVKKFVGYLRYDTLKEQEVLNDLYHHELRLYKNFFQPVIKLVAKERIGGKIYRRYDTPKTPYQRVMESKEVSEKTKQELKKIYQSLNPAQLKRVIDKKLDLLYQAYQKKTQSQKVAYQKKVSVRFLIAQPEPILVR